MEFPNWFEGQKYNFEKHLEQFKGKPNLTFLQLGVYTGDASEWLCENILTDDSSMLVDVDTWAGSDESEHTSIDFGKVFSYYNSRIAKYDKVVKMRMTTQEYFTKYFQFFNFIYVDANHTADAVAYDAVNSWKLLKRGGILAFDDYMWGQDMKPELTPRPAIDNFLEFHEGEYKILTMEYQVWIEKL